MSDPTPLRILFHSLTQQMAFTLMSQEEYGTLERSKTTYQNTRDEFDEWVRSGLTGAATAGNFRSRCKC